MRLSGTGSCPFCTRRSVVSRLVTPCRKAHGPDSQSSAAQVVVVSMPFAFCVAATMASASAMMRGFRPSSSAILSPSGSATHAAAFPCRSLTARSSAAWSSAESRDMAPPRESGVSLPWPDTRPPVSWSRPQFGVNPSSVEAALGPYCPTSRTNWDRCASVSNARLSTSTPSAAQYACHLSPQEPWSPGMSPHGSLPPKYHPWPSTVSSSVTPTVVSACGGRVATTRRLRTGENKPIAGNGKRRSVLSHHRRAFLASDRTVRRDALIRTSTLDS